jgi:cortactin
MWKAAVGVKNGGGKPPQNAANDADDDWETDPDFINDVSEQEQRWGSKTVEGSGRSIGAIE